MVVLLSALAGAQGQGAEPLGLDSLNMSQVWSLPLGSVTAVAVEGDTGLVALGYKVLLVETKDSLRDVRVLGQLEAPGPVSFMRGLGGGKVAVVVEDTALYLLDLQVLQFSSSYFKADVIYDVIYDGTYLYVADQNLDVVDASDMSRVGYYSPPVGVAKGVDFISDSTVAVACSTGGLRVLLITDPAYPYEIGSNTSQYIGRVRVVQVGDSVFAYGVRDYNYVGYDVYIFVVNDPLNPTYWTYSRGNTYSSPVRDMVLDSAHRLIAVSSGTYGVQLWRIKDDGKLEYWTRAAPTWFRNIAYSQKGALWLSGGNGNLYIYETPIPRYRLRYDSPGLARDAEGYGDWYVVADGSGGLEVLKFNYQWNWSLYDAVTLEGSALGVAMNYPHAFVASGTGGVYYYNVTLADTLDHIHLGTSTVNQVALAKGNTVLLASALPRELYLVDVSDPENMDTLAHYTADAGLAVDVAAEGDYAYLALGAAGVAVLDISNPANPSLVTRFAAPDAVNALTVSDGTLYLATNSGLGIYDVSDPSNPSLLTFFETQTQLQNVKGPYEVYGRKFIYAVGGNMFFAIDVTDPSKPYLATRTRPSSYQVYAVSAPDYRPFYILACNAENGLLLYQWGPTLDTFNLYTGSYKGNAKGVGLAANVSGVVYLDSLSNVAKFFDITDPESPVYLSSFDAYPYGALGMGDHYVVLNRQNRYIRLYDFSDPANPTLVYSVDFGYVGRLGKMVTANDSVLLVVYYNQYVRSYVLRNDSLVYKGQLNIGASIQDLFFDGTYLWLTTPTTLQAIDVSDPENMNVVGLFSGLTNAGEAVVFDTLAFVIDQFPDGDTLRVIDTSPLYWMEQKAVWALDTTGTSLDLWVVEPGDSAVLYVLNGPRLSVYLVDLPDSMPMDDTLGYYLMAKAPNQFVVHQSNYIYLALGTDGMAALKVNLPWLSTDERPSAPFSLLLAPNPSRSAQLRLTLAGEEKVKISLFDMAGRRAAEVFNGKLGSGSYTFALPANLRSGVYVVQVKVGQRSVRKLWVKR